MCNENNIFINSINALFNMLIINLVTSAVAITPETSQIYLHYTVFYSHYTVYRVSQNRVYLFQ